MYPFRYHRPASAAAAEAALAAAPEARPLAGGMSLVPTMRHRLARPSDLVDLAGVAGLDGIVVEDGAIVVGAMTPHAAVASSAEVARAIPALARLAGGIGDPLVRNRGTLGGSLAHNDPAADYPAAALGLAASIVTSRRTVAADAFFVGAFETALDPGEIVVRVRFPIPDRAAYVKFPNPASRFSIVGAFVSLTGGAARVAITGAGACVFRQTAFEAALSQRFAPDAIEPIEVAPDGLIADLHGDAEYRAHLIGVLAQDAVAAAVGPAPPPG